MKVAYINTVFEVKSTGRTYAEVKKHLESKGHQCKAFYGNGKSNVENAHRIGNFFTYYFHNILARITGLQGYFSVFPTISLIKKLKDFDPDIIHLGNMHANYLNLPILFKYLNKIDKPIFIISHDCWFFTGKCTHFIYYDCDKWMSKCYNCPAKKPYPQSYFFDFSRKMFKDKKRWLTSIKNLNIVCVSNWMNDNVSRSFLKDKNIVTNYNWINTEIFHSISKEEKIAIKKELGLKEDEKFVVTVSSLWNTKSTRYRDVLRLVDMLDDDQKMLIIGGSKNDFEPNKKIIHIPFVSDVSKLAKYYASADVFVHFSNADTFGKVIAEAQCCGTPAVVYDVTACGEIAKIGNGYPVPLYDVKKAYEVICDLFSKSDSQIEAERNEREIKTRETLKKETRLEKLLNYYEESLSN